MCASFGCGQAAAEEAVASGAAADNYGDLEEAPGSMQAAPAPKGPCKTVHAWVLVMPGKRDIAEPLFIETTTVSAVWMVHWGLGHL
jgi:hypothetical protein